MPVMVKVCGITRYEDARVAANLGVDALGFILHPASPRYIAPERIAAITRRLPPFIARVGVFVDASPEQIVDAAQTAGLNAVQLHGAESPAIADAIPFPVIKAFAVGDAFDLDTLQRYAAAGLLLDTWDRGRAGGTGKTFDWTVARRAVQRHDNIILAGGLGPANIAEALESVRPYAVDLNSGVEIRPGEKNPMKMRDAVSIVKNWK